MRSFSHTWDLQKQSIRQIFKGCLRRGPGRLGPKTPQKVECSYRNERKSQFRPKFDESMDLYNGVWFFEDAKRTEADNLMNQTVRILKNPNTFLKQNDSFVAINNNILFELCVHRFYTVMLNCLIFIEFLF